MVIEIQKPRLRDRELFVLALQVLSRCTQGIESTAAELQSLTNSLPGEQRSLPVDELATAVIRRELSPTNINIPGTTGHDAAEFLKEKCPQMRVLMVTGLPNDIRVLIISGNGSYEICQEVAAQTFLHKPFLPAKLCAKIREVRAAPHDRYQPA